ncbi:MAG: phenylalanine--tRNA ligase subunit alpha, partial [Pseudomonadales bacterium]|nr:phenylalanine--tRNA ligase subunit alpha [Pseudomonadales bacterium]
MSDLETILSAALEAVSASSDLSTLDNVRVQYAGKKGEITSLLKGLGQLPADERPAAGAEINKARDAFNSALETRKDALQSAEINAQLEAEAIDVTLPGRESDTGALHPVTLVMERIERFFRAVGYD